MNANRIFFRVYSRSFSGSLNESGCTGVTDSYGITIIVPVGINTGRPKYTFYVEDVIHALLTYDELKKLFDKKNLDEISQEETHLSSL